MQTNILLQTVSAATSVNSGIFDLNDLVRYSIGVVFTGADVVGSLKLQASLDNITFFDVADSTQAVTASTNHVWDVTECGYKSVRVSWTYTSGTGNITIKLFVKNNVVTFG